MMYTIANINNIPHIKQQTMPDNEVHVWLTNLSEIRQLNLLPHYTSLLNQEERNRLSTIPHPLIQQQFISTRVLLRTTLSLYRPEIHPKQWQFSKTPYGKPFIAHPRDQTIQFNLSHSGDYIGLALSLNHKIGVDIEKLTRRDSYSDIAESFFSQKEMYWLHNSFHKSQNRDFFALWTLKEAYIKACGTGLSTQLNDFSILFKKNQKPYMEEILDEIPAGYKWQLWSLNINKYYMLGLALRLKAIDPTANLVLKHCIPLHSGQDLQYVA